MASIAAAPPIGPARETQLRKGALGLADDTVVAISSTAPAYSIATSLAGLGTAVALHAPAAIIVGFLPVMGIAVAFWLLNRIEQDCGASYSWVRRFMGKPLGFMNGWVIIVADVIFCAFAGPQCGQATLQLINNAHLTSLGPISLDATNSTADVVVGVLWLALLTWMVVVGIRMAAKFQWVLLALEYFIVLGFAIGGLFHGGGSAFSADWFNPFTFGGLGPLAAGVVISVFFYWGWDTAANLNEESGDAAEAPGRAGMLGMVALLGIFLVTAASIQHVLTPDQIVGSGIGTLSLFASSLVPEPLASLAVLALISSTVATVQTTLLPSARTAFSMGRDGSLGRVWAIVHPTFRTPWIGTIIFGILSGGIALLSLKLGGLNAVVAAGVTSIGVMVSYYYGMTGIACAVAVARRGIRSASDVVLGMVIPVASALTLGALAGYFVVNSWRSADSLSLDASNGRFVAILPLALIASGIPAYVWSALRRRPPVAPEPGSVELLGTGNRQGAAVVAGANS